MFVYLDLVEQFSCKQCGTCCRNNWLVTVDEAGYRRNRELFQARGRSAEFLQAFIPLASEADYGEYARIAKREDGGYWFLTPQHLCRLQQIAGHEHLDTVCQWFPRYPMDTERGIELSLSFSCPAALNLALRAEPLRVIRSEKLPIATMPIDFINHVYPSQQPENSALRYYFEIEQHLIGLLQERQIPLVDRLLLVRGFVIELGRFADPESMGRDINNLRQADYAKMDQMASSQVQGMDSPVHWLIENYFVNFIFRKSLYVHGLAKTVRQFDRMQERLRKPLGGTGNARADTQATVDVILQMELEYNHNSRKIL